MKRSQQDRNSIRRIIKGIPIELIQRTCAALFPVALLALISCSSTSTTPPPAEENISSSHEEGVPGGVTVTTVEVSATITAIDRARRMVTLLGPEGVTSEVKLGPEAVNFDQFKVGDLVNVTMTEELVVHLGDEEAPQGDGAAVLVARAPKGAQPGGVAAKTTRDTGTVTAIDQETRSVTIRFEDGSTQTFHVRDDIDLSQQKLGQKVVFQVTEVIAITVEKP